MQRRKTDSSESDIDSSPSSYKGNTNIAPVAKRERKREKLLEGLHKLDVRLQ